MPKSRSKKELETAKARSPGAFQTHKGGAIRNSKDPTDPVAEEIRKRTARAAERERKRKEKQPDHQH